MSSSYAIRPFKRYDLTNPRHRRFVRRTARTDPTHGTHTTWVGYNAYRPILPEAIVKTDHTGMPTDMFRLAPPDVYQPGNEYVRSVDPIADWAHMTMGERFEDALRQISKDSRMHEFAPGRYAYAVTEPAPDAPVFPMLT